MAQSNIKPADQAIFSAKNGGAGGIFFELPLSSWLSVGPEVLYVQKGGKLNVMSVDIQYGFDYIDIPLLLKIRLGGQTFGFTLFGGAAYGFLMSAKGSALGVEADVSSQIKKNDLSGHFGAALIFGLDKGAELFFSGRYILGIQEIDDDGDSTDSMKNNAVLALMGIRFGLGKN